MIEIKNKKDCCGCTACKNICPKKAIKMVLDEEGFIYPRVDKEKCINCGLCEKICPILNNNKSDTKAVCGYALRCKDENVLSTSTSGGFFTSLAEYVLNNNGVVFGVGFDEQFAITHKCATKKKDITEFRGSKYVQSNLGNTFKEISKYLNENKLVLFTGTPCQIVGLKNYLKKEYNNLITMDVVCHGVSSPLLWHEYRKYLEKKYKSKFLSVNFRNKTYGYHAGSMKIEFASGRKYFGSARVDYILKSFFKEISSRPSCYNCNFKFFPHKSDFTVFDCWNVTNLVENVKDDDKGYTNLIVNTKHGNEIFELIKNKYKYYSADIKKMIDLDGIMIYKCVKPHKNRDDFYKSINEIGVEKTIDKYIPISKKDIFIEKIKKPLYKFGLIKLSKKIKKILK